MKLISVIIPCYNAEKYIVECLLSVINQTYKNWEIICVNDGSSDTTLDVLNEYQAKYSEQIKVLSIKNQGAPAARNEGLANAKGDYIQFLDADDILLPEKFEKQLFSFSDEIDMIVSDRSQKNVDLTKTIQDFYFNDISANPLETAIRRVIITGNPLYRKTAVVKLGGYNEQLNSAQDWDFHIRLILAGYQIKYVAGFYFINRKVEGSVSSNWIKVCLQAADLILELKPQLLNNEMMNEPIRQHLAQIYMDSAIYSKDSLKVKLYINELKFWSRSNYSFIHNSLKKVTLKVIGIKNLVYLYRRLKRN